ncbi:protein Star [Procambarus clarkii]|uniref:protein Star n=1 Tax=Procambarus clarkii TaxID=6728 RepID=UPI003743A5B6
MSDDKARTNSCWSRALLTVIGLFGLVLLLQVAVMLFGPSKSVCTKQVCLAKFLEGPPAFNDETMASYLKRNYFLPPAATEYNLSGHDGTSNKFNSLVQFIKEHFKNKRGGVFVDVGAGDGEYRSITLQLEKSLGWTGLLVEPNERLYKKLLKKGRKAQLTKTCVSPYTYPAMMTLSHPRVEEGASHEVETLGKGKIEQFWTKDEKVQHDTFEAQCVPLENLVYAAGITTAIDLLVLDMSGTDFDVLVNTKIDALPELEMIVVNSNGAKIQDDVGGYFLERNMLLKEIIVENEITIYYILLRFDAQRDL